MRFALHEYLLPHSSPLLFPLPHQGRSTYVVPTQQYPVQPGAPGFYPSASPTEFGTYGKQGKESGESESQGAPKLTYKFLDPS